MTRKHVLFLALAGSAALLFGTRMAIVWAQPAPVVERAPSADNVPRDYPPVPATPVARQSANSAAGAGWTTPVLASSMAADDDPEMAELLQSEAKLARSAEELVARYADSESEAERKDIHAGLRNILAKQFDAQRKRRELELTRIEEQVRKLREQIKKRDDARETIIDRRLDQLVNDAEGLGWAPAAGPALRTGSGLPAAEMMRPPRPATKAPRR